MGTGEGAGENRAVEAAEAAISNPLLDDVSMKGARGVLINITGGPDLTLFEVDEAANRIRDEVDPDANIIFGSTFDESLEGTVRVSVVATGIDAEQAEREREEGRQTTEVEVSRPVAVNGGMAMRTNAQSSTTRQPAADPVAGTRRPARPRPGAARTQVQADPAQTGKNAARNGGAPQAAVEEDSFIAPEPVRAADPAPQPRLNIEESGTRQTQAEPTLATAEETEPGQSRRLSFLQRVTGVGRGRTQGDQGDHGNAEEATTPARRAPRLESLDDLASARNEDDDLLEIPAFLRRQAN